MKKEYKGSSPPFGEWKPWQNELEPGHYYTIDESISSVRAWFLQSGRRPLVMLKGDGFNVKSLIYDLLPAFDKTPAGHIFIHSVPDNAWEIKQWLDALNLGIEYTGEGLPCVSQKVLLHLIKFGKERLYLTGEQKAALLE